jgi:hypothetical protein
MSEKTKKLLLELLLLKVKYEEETFKDVSKLLQKNNDDFLCHVLALLKSVENNHLSSQSMKQRKQQLAPSSALNTQNDTKKDQLLREIDTLLRSKDVFKVKKHLQEYVAQRVQLTKKTNTIEQLINFYIHEYKDRSEEELKAELKLLIGIRDSKADVSKFLNMANEIVKARKDKRY